MERVFDMLFVFFYRSWKFPLSSITGCGWLIVAFYDMGATAL